MLGLIELHKAHARYERAMADIKSLNLTPAIKEHFDDHLFEISKWMNVCVFAAELLAREMKPYHMPHEAAPNAIKQEKIK